MRSRLAWRLRRALAMSGAELVHRVAQAAKTGIERVGFLRASDQPEILTRRLPPSWFSLQPPGVDVPAIIAAADELIAGHWRVFALHDTVLGFPPVWQRDPKTGKQAPVASFGKAINYRDETVVGDIKYLWEINRHLELVTLAQAWHLTSEGKYMAACGQFLRDWLAASPYPQGINWISSLELAIRLVNWSVAWYLLGGDKSRLFDGAHGATFKQQWLVSIYQHGHFIRGYLSLHSSANNHLLGELMGLYVASAVWPIFRESETWRDFAQRAFEREVLTQNAPDGVNLEQAVYYQHEVMDMMLVCQCVAQASGGSFSIAFMDRLERLAEYLAAITDVAGQVPMFGDADDALVVRWSPRQASDPYRSLLATAAVIFQRVDFKALAGRFDDKSAWLLGQSGLSQWQRLAEERRAPVRTSFPTGGMYLLGSRLGTADEVRLVIDCAALGFLNIAAHGHADALSFTLSAGGEEILVDPGTFSYHTQAKWRNHFRGTAAHNTVRVDGLDQSEIGGPFLWMRKARSDLIRHDAGSRLQVFEGRHDGYGRLADPVMHIRRIEFDEERNQITVTDFFDCQHAHEVEICWQFGESVALGQEENTLIASGRLHQVRMVCDATLALQMYCGSDSPIAGWVSRRFDTKTASWCARWSGRITPNACVKTTIQIVRLGGDSGVRTAAALERCGLVPD